MPITDWKITSNATNVDRDEEEEWLRPSQAEADDNLWAEIPLKVGVYSDWLRCDTFGFDTGDIPEGATVNGVEVRITRKSKASEISESAIYLRDSSGQVGDNKASSTPIGTNEETITHGAADDDWNASLASSDIRASTFGVDISLLHSEEDTGELGDTAYIDFVEIRVHYSEGGETYEKTVAMDALLRAQDSEAVDLDTILRARDSKGVDIGALLRDTDTKQISIDSFLKSIDISEVSIDSLLRALGVETSAALDILLRSSDIKEISIDALIKILGVPKTVAIDIILRAGGASSVDLDALLRGPAQSTIDLDALLRSLGVTETVSIDALIALVDQVKTADIDALLRGEDSSSLSIDMLMRALAVVETVDLDALIMATDSDTDVVIDLILKATDASAVDIDSLLKGFGIPASVALDAVLGGLGIQSVDVDALLLGQAAVDLAIDIILKTYPDAALRFIVEVRDSSGNLLAILENAHAIAYSQMLNQMPTLDFAFPAADAKKDHLTWGNEIWLRDYRTGSVVHKFRIGMRRDRR